MTKRSDTAATECVVRLEHGRKSFGGNEVLRDISFEVRPREVVAIIGPSGGGKSTLLRCLTLLERLDGGGLWYGGVEGDPEVAVAVPSDGGDRAPAVYGDKRTLALARQRFGLVFQNFNLFPHMTVMQNITDAPIVVQGRSRSEVEGQARALLEKMGLQGCEDKVPCQLSGGQQQRASIARALCLNPQILFFDEPTSALDPELTGEVLKVLKQLAAEDTTMIVVTHEMSFAREVADRVIFMDGGVIVEEGPADQVMGSPRNERTREFLGRYDS
ncbi:MAG: amino acid ABC transporter ATP-binding protein [Collinsella sp.]|nr:amino acid ABC transporter ATP-binding protein [Collinsella sp.]